MRSWNNRWKHGSWFLPTHSRLPRCKWNAYWWCKSIQCIFIAEKGKFDIFLKIKRQQKLNPGFNIFFHQQSDSTLSASHLQAKEKLKAFLSGPLYQKFLNARYIWMLKFFINFGTSIKIILLNKINFQGWCNEKT